MSSGNTTISYTPGGGDDPANPFHYMPSMPATVVALICFILCFIGLSIWTIWKRSWYMIALLVGVIIEIIGYGTRIPLVEKPVGQIPLYACMHSCIIIAPVFNAAIQYVLFGRLVHAVGDQYSLIKPKIVAWIFIICDVISFFVQAGGAGMLITASTNPESAKTGQSVLLGGLAINLATFGIFCLQIFVFDYRTRKTPPALPSGGVCKKGWRQFLYVIYLSSFLVLVRQIFRVIEFAQGFTGYLAVHEVYFYIFDTIPIFLSTAIFIIAFPGNGYIPRKKKNSVEFLAENGKPLPENNKYLSEHNKF